MGSAGQSVSIHTRPEDRVKQDFAFRFAPASACFNPHPARRPGETHIVFRAGRTGCCFNPHPARRPGETAEREAVKVEKGSVSIHTRPEDRVKPKWARRLRWFKGCFNPHPARRPGETRYGRLRTRRRASVSIHTRPEDRVKRKMRDLRDFGNRVSIHTRPEDRVKLRGRTDNASLSTVSIHTRPEDRVKLYPNKNAALPYICFNPHPARRPGETVYLVRVPGKNEAVSIHTRPEDRVKRWV